MSETKIPNPNLPSGYDSAEQLARHAVVGPDLLPWAQEQQEVKIAHCKLRSGEEFYLASAINANQDLIDAANAMSDHQKQITDNMFYSRLPEFIEHGYSRSIDVVPHATPSFQVYVLKNKGGQRVYFGRAELELIKNDPNDEDVRIPVIMRLAACDKNGQKLVMKHLGSGKPDKGSK